VPLQCNLPVTRASLAGSESRVRLPPQCAGPGLLPRTRSHGTITVAAATEPHWHHVPRPGRNRDRLLCHGPVTAMTMMVRVVSYGGGPAAATMMVVSYGGGPAWLSLGSGFPASLA